MAAVRLSKERTGFGELTAEKTRGKQLAKERLLHSTQGELVKCPLSAPSESPRAIPQVISYLARLAFVYFAYIFLACYRHVRLSLPRLGA